MNACRKILIVALIAVATAQISICADEESPNALIKALYDRSDLIIDATVIENCGGGMGSGPIPTEEAQIGYLQCPMRVKINRVLKGDFSTDKPIYIEITFTINTPARDANGVNNIKQIDKFSVQNSVDFNLLKKGERYFFFLEDRPKREPNSYDAVGNEEIRFRSFDDWLWRLPVDDTMPIQFLKWNKEKSKFHQ